MISLEHKEPTTIPLPHSVFLDIPKDSTSVQLHIATALAMNPWIKTYFNMSEVEFEYVPPKLIITKKS
jgi:hypothetical protein